MSTLHTRIRQWALLEGVRHVHSDLLVVRIGTSQANSRRKGQLFVVVEAVDNPVHGRAACALAAETLCAAFYADRTASITSSLRQAFRAAHQAVANHNRRAPAAERTLVGASCAVVHNDTLYLAQALPSSVFFHTNGQLRALPDFQAKPSEDQHHHALGSPLYTTPSFAHAPLNAGDTLVLCSSNVAHRLAPERAAAAIMGHDASAIADELYAQCADHLYEAQVLVVEWLALAEDQEENMAARVASRSRRPATPRVLAREQPLPTTVAPRTEPVGKLPARTGSGARSRTHATLDDDQAPGRSVAPPPQRAEPSNQPPPLARSPRIPSLHGHAQRPAPQPARRQTVAPRTSKRWLLTVLLACVVALVGLGVQQFGQRDTRVALAALADVQQAVTAAEQASTPAQAQQALIAAERAFRTQVEPLVQTGVITESRAALWEEYRQVVGAYDQAMAAINRVSFVDQLQTIATLPNGQGLINRIVLGAPNPTTNTPSLFLLDRSNGRVLEAGNSAPLLQKGDTVADLPVTRLRNILWRGDKLLLLERGDPTAPAYRLLYRDDEQWVATRLARSETMAPIDGDLPMAAFGGNIYLWDRDVKQVWQYTAGQLSLPPVPLVGDVGEISLDRVVDIAVDGRIYLLNSDGSVVVLENGTVVQQFPAPQLAQPLSTVVRFVVTPDWTAADGTPQPGAIYLLDTQNERVIKLDKATGAVVQQIQARRAGVLNQLSDLAVDEPGRTLYLANGAQVLQTPLPALPQFGTSAPAEPPK